MSWSVKMRALVAGVAVLALAACETANPVQPQPDLTFEHVQPLSLAVANVQIVDAYQAPLAPPNVEHRFRTRPSVALQRWGAAKLRAAGGTSNLKMTIQEASVVEEPLSLDTSLRGQFTNQQAFRYNAKLTALVEVLNTAGGREAHTVTEVTRSITVPENASLNDRDQAWLDVTEKAMADFETEMAKNMGQFLAPWIRR